MKQMIYLNGDKIEKRSGCFYINDNRVEGGKMTFSNWKSFLFGVACTLALFMVVHIAASFVGSGV